MTKGERISRFVEELEGSAPLGAQADIANHPCYRGFFRCWNEQRYYEAHDVLEQLWLEEDNADTARFFQGLIQAAGAFVHLQKNFKQPLHAKHSRRLRPATRLFALALRNLDHLPDEFWGVDLVRFRELLGKVREEIIASEFLVNPWSPENAPRFEATEVKAAKTL
jgi:predicted metal-dependent hydrolase